MLEFCEQPRRATNTPKRQNRTAHCSPVHESGPEPAPVHESGPVDSSILCRCQSVSFLSVLFWPKWSHVNPLPVLSRLSLNSQSALSRSRRPSLSSQSIRLQPRRPSMNSIMLQLWRPPTDALPFMLWPLRLFKVTLPVLSQPGGLSMSLLCQLHPGLWLCPGSPNPSWLLHGPGPPLLHGP